MAKKSLVPIEIQEQQKSILAVITQAAANPKVDIEKMRALLDMQKEIMAQQALMAYSAAMRDCQAAIQPVVRGAENKHTSSKYAKLEKIDEEIRPIYTKHGFSLSFDYEKAQNNEIRIMCNVMHVGGHTQTHKLDGELDCTGSQGKANKTKIQGLGSSVSFLRRYLTCMIFNVVLRDEDDDGNTGSKPPVKNNEFASRVAAQGKVTDAWSISINGQLCAYNDPESAGKALLEAIGGKESKQDRIDLIGLNAPFLRDLAKAGMESLAQEAHALVDKVK